MLEALQNIDRRIVYLALFALSAALLLWPVRLPMLVSQEARDFFQTVEKAPKDKLVLVAADWDVGTQPENAPQTEAVLRHLMTNRCKFAIVGFAFPPGPALVESIAADLAPHYRYRYGEDWVNLGFKPNLVVALMALAKDIPGFFKTDAKGTAIAELPVMEGVKDIHDVGLVAEFTSAGTIEAYIAFVGGPFKTPLAQGCTAVIGPQQYAYLDAAQLQGLLVGMRGAAEYETLLRRHARGMRAMSPLSSAHLLIILLIILGNVGYLAARARSARLPEGERP